MVDVGLTLVEPLAELDVNVPGVIAMVVAPLVTQFSVLLAPELIPVGFAVKEVIAGFVPVPDDELDEFDTPPHPKRPAQTKSATINRPTLNAEKRRETSSRFRPDKLITRIGLHASVSKESRSSASASVQRIGEEGFWVAHLRFSPFDRFLRVERPSRWCTFAQTLRNGKSRQSSTFEAGGLIEPFGVH